MAYKSGYNGLCAHAIAECRIVHSDSTEAQYGGRLQSRLQYLVEPSMWHIEQSIEGQHCLLTMQHQHICLVSCPVLIQPGTQAPQLIQRKGSAQMS